MNFNVTWRPIAAALATSVWLAGCSGTSTPVTPSSALSAPAQVQNGPGLDAVHPADGSQCNNGPLQVSPCFVSVGRGYGRYAQVTVHYPGGDQLTEKNNCNRGSGHFHFGKGRIARVRGAGQNWTVSSGNKRGNCRAVFTDWHNGQRTSLGVAIHNAG